MFKPERRNRNIGTTASGHGQDNKMCIPESWVDRYGNYTSYLERVEPNLNQLFEVGLQSIRIIFERPREGHSYGCSPADIVHLLSLIENEFRELPSFFVFRQPTKKQNQLSPVWGRFLYRSDFKEKPNSERENSAIVLESQKIGNIIRYPNKISLADQEELKRLKNDGHTFTKSRRYQETILTKDSIRKTILYRTVLHELGHWKQYCDNVIFKTTSLDSDWDTSWDLHHSQPTIEKENFANRFSDDLAKRLCLNGYIPFEPRDFL